MRRDGYQLDVGTGQVHPVGPSLVLDSLAAVCDPSAIHEHIDRLRRAVMDDPALAVGSAKELIESVAKVVLVEVGEQVDEKSDLPELVRAA